MAQLTLSSNYSFNQWTNTNDPSLSKTNNISTLNIDPIQDLSNQGYIFGKVKSVYNFISNKLGSSNNNRFYISEISSNRTEIRLASNFISNESLEISYDAFKKELNDANYFDEFYLNFGNNNSFARGIERIISIHEILNNDINRLNSSRVNNTFNSLLL